MAPQVIDYLAQALSVIAALVVCSPVLLLLITQRGAGLMWDALLGMAVAAGVFTRFTYLFFFAPMGVAYLLFHSRSGLWPTRRKALPMRTCDGSPFTYCSPSHTRRRLLARWPRGSHARPAVRDAYGLPDALGLLRRSRLSLLWHAHALAARNGTSLILPCAHAHAHAHKLTFPLAMHQVVPWHGLWAALSQPAEWSQLTLSGSLTLTPWNSLRYNMQVDNLSTPPAAHTCV
jgi:hypothetical protein